MQWVGSLVATLVLALLLIPMVAAVASVFVLGAVNWLFARAPSMARTGFYCPYSKRWVTTGFLTEAGAEQPADVLSCSRFEDEHAVTCGKKCVTLATSGWSASCMEPRYALLSGDVAYRPVAGTSR